MSILLKLFKEVQGEEILPKSFLEARIILTQNQAKELQRNLFTEGRCKLPKILVNRLKQVTERSYIHQTKWALYQDIKMLQYMQISTHNLSFKKDKNHIIISIDVGRFFNNHLWYNPTFIYNKIPAEKRHRSAFYQATVISDKPTINIILNREKNQKLSL